jgi:hypothetical protein
VAASVFVSCASAAALTVTETRAAAQSDRPRREMFTRSMGAAPVWQAHGKRQVSPPAAAGGCWNDDRAADEKRPARYTPAM